MSSPEPPLPKASEETLVIDPSLPGYDDQDHDGLSRRVVAAVDERAGAYSKAVGAPMPAGVRRRLYDLLMEIGSLRGDDDAYVEAFEAVAVCKGEHEVIAELDEALRDVRYETRDPKTKA